MIVNGETGTLTLNLKVDHCQNPQEFQKLINTIVIPQIQQHTNGLPRAYAYVGQYDMETVNAVAPVAHGHGNARPAVPNIQSIEPAVQAIVQPVQQVEQMQTVQVVPMAHSKSNINVNMNANGNRNSNRNRNGNNISNRIPDEEMKFMANSPATTSMTSLHYVKYYL